MNVSLTPELEKLVNKKVKSGLYNSASEVVREALRLLQEQDQLREIRRAELRKEVMKGVEQVRKGEYVEYENPEDLVEEIIKKGTAARSSSTSRRKQNTAE